MTKQWHNIQKHVIEVEIQWTTALIRVRRSPNQYASNTNRLLLILTGFRSDLDEHIDAELATEEVEFLEEALEDIEFCIKEKIESMIPMLAFIELLPTLRYDYWSFVGDLNVSFSDILENLLDCPDFPELSWERNFEKYE